MNRRFLAAFTITASLAFALMAVFSGCVSLTRDLSSLDELTPEQRHWITEIKKYIHPKELRKWLEAAPAGKNGMTIPRATWPPWLSHPGGSLKPPFKVVRLRRTDRPGVYYILDFGPGLSESGISLEDPVGPHAATAMVEWEKGIYFFFSRIPSPPRLPWMDEEIDLTH